ncbi:curli biogenesis system outer membrane secretion channel CsgG [Paraburkholderia sp. WSM4175]|uniref:CsgG/HfaB family protein n=1 Tax=Paraburkholderia sp. WSM4175 TaxID=2991072 RepID=UPI003D20BEDB
MTSPSIKVTCGVIVAAILLAACQKKTTDNEAVSAPAASTVQQAAAAPASAPLRAKPDFGGVTTQHVEVTATGPTQEAAVNNAIRLAIEQTNGKRIDSASVQVNTGSSGKGTEVSSPAYAELVASATSGAVSHFQILSQRQISAPTSTDEENLKASQGESWNKGNVDASASSNASMSRRVGLSGNDDSTSVDASASGHASASESEKLKGSWDQHQGAQQVDYNKKHVDYVTKWEVRIGADVATYRQSDGAKLTIVVVAQPQVQEPSYQVGDSSISSDAIAAEVQSKISEALTQTHRFTVLDRNADAAISEEIRRIQAGNTTPADTARLGQQLTADLIVIPTINRFEYARHQHKLEMADRTLVSYSGGGEVAFRVVNAITGQMVMSQSFKYEFPSTAPTTLGVSVEGRKLASGMMDSMDHSIVASILQSTYPLSVVQAQGKNVVINQGGDALQEGATYQAVTLGKPITDPQSGQSLGPTETPCCRVRIDRVSVNLSYGHIVEDGVQIPAPFTPGSMELRGQVAATTPKEANLAASTRVALHVGKKHASESGNTPSSNDSNW